MPEILMAYHIICTAVSFNLATKKYDTVAKKRHNLNMVIKDWFLRMLLVVVDILLHSPGPVIVYALTPMV